MSVLNQSGEEQVECPLCMEPLEVDDLNFFPCTCGYQICRFCWHRIRTDENGLCPACRKAYSENPADFTPLSKEQVAQLKADKRQRDQQRKAKLSESRKHLANVRVVQKNLVFVVGLPLRLADAEILKRHEYFGKFGKIHKVVINQSTSYAGTQGPSASAYVTYMKSDDALRAIQSVNNITIDGRLIKSSLGTTKYCSHFMKNQTCPKPDCMYLHDFGDPKASFTKEQMHAGKHQEYERKLHEILVTKMALQAAQQAQQQNDCKSSELPTIPTSATTTTAANTSKESWPQLNPEKNSDKKPEASKDKTQKNKVKVKNSECSKKLDKSKVSEISTKAATEEDEDIEDTARSKEDDQQPQQQLIVDIEKDKEKVESSLPKLPLLDDNSSFFSQNTFQKIVTDIQDDDDSLITDSTENQTQILNDSLPTINSSEDWEAAFGFSKHNNHLEELAKQRSNIKDTLETFGTTYNNTNDMFGNLEGHYNSYDTNNKLHESILEALSSNKHNNSQTQFGALPYPKTDRVNGFNNGYYGANSYDQMSKFLQDFYKNSQKDVFSGSSNTIPNGLNGYNMHNGLTERNNLLLMQQRQLEEQLLNLNLKQSYNQQLLQNGIHNNPYLNGDIIAQNGLLHNQFYQNSVNSMIAKTNSKQPDDLDFDPFHETQKGFAELIQESEQSHKLQGIGRSPGVNGLIHSQSANNHMPPPPPGFMQNNAHMNSFGSKILPYLNMGNNPPHQNQICNNTQNGWSSSYSQMQQQQQQQQQQLKGLGTCNDWKVLDPAIVTSSRHFLLANVPPREHYNNIQPLLSSSSTQQLQNGPSISNNRSSSYDYTNFSNFNPQVQNNSYNNFSHITTQQNLNWLGNEISSQITSPPGFRSNNHQTSKQQEC